MSKYIIPDIKGDTIGSVTSNLELELPDRELQRRDQQHPLVLYPQLACKVNRYKDKIIFSQDGRDFVIQMNSDLGERLQIFFSLMDGTRSLSELYQMLSPNNPEVVNTIVRYLDEQKLLDDVAQVRVNSGIDTVLELEDLANELLSRSIDKNPFYQAIESKTSDLPINALYGFAIENYHFLSRKCYFNSSVLGFQSSVKIRQLMNERYCQEYGQDRLLQEALNAIGIGYESLMETMLLPETIALCNALTYWASFEPLFFFSSLKVLADQTVKNFEFYLKACEQAQLNTCFIEPIRQLVNTKLKRKPENLTCQIFQEFLHVDQETKQRFRGQTHLLIEMYNNFHRAIWNYYSSTSNLLRRVSAI